MKDSPQNQMDKGEVNLFILSIILIGVFPALGAIFYIGAKTLIHVDMVVNFAIIAGVIAFVLHVPFLKRMNRYLAEIIGYSLFGWGLIITAIFLGGNFLFHGQPVTEVYQVETATAHPEERELPFPVSVTLKPSESSNNIVPAAAYNDHPDMLSFHGSDEEKFNDRPALAKMTSAKGLFGYEVLLYKELD